MEIKYFVERTRELFDECLALMDKKGVEYSGKEDKFANFKKEAAKLDVFPEMICHIYLCKHLDSIDNFIKRYIHGEKITEIEETLSEPITGRFVDAINYLTILKGMIDETRNEELTNL
jgi:dsRNA-specific ribonuclease